MDKSKVKSKYEVENITQVCTLHECITLHFYNEKNNYKQIKLNIYFKPYKLGYLQDVRCVDLSTV